MLWQNFIGVYWHLQGGLSSLHSQVSRLCVSITKLEGSGSQFEATEHDSICATLQQTYRLWVCQKQFNRGLRVFENSLGKPFEFPSGYSPHYSAQSEQVQTLHRKLQKSHLIEIPIINEEQLHPKNSWPKRISDHVKGMFGLNQPSCASNMLLFTTSPLEKALYKVSLTLLDGEKLVHTLRSIFQAEPNENSLGLKKGVHGPLAISIIDMKTAR